MSVAPLPSRREPDAPPAAAASLVDLLHARALDAFDRPALVLDVPPARDASAGSTLTWGELIAAALDYARVIEVAGLVRGDRLAHVGPHSAEWIIVDLACLLTGVVHVALHADESPREIDEQLNWLIPQGIVQHQSGKARGSANARRAWAAPALRGDFCRPRAGATQSVNHHPAPPSFVSTVSAALDRATVLESLAARAGACDPDAPAAIFLSSGTTGQPRAVVHSQRALAWNATASSDVFLDDPRDVRLSWLPLCHAYARVGDLYTALVRGGTLCVVPDRQRALDTCRRVSPTVILGVPAFFERLAAGVSAGRIRDLAAALGGQVRVCVSGGAPLKDRTAAVFAAQGVPLVQGYGLAEAGPVVALASPRTVRAGTVGPPLPGVELRFDARGQVCVRSPSTALAVIEPGEASPRPATRDGWLETGDTGAFDAAGHLTITGRVVDTLVLSTGAKVPPAEVERALAEDPAVAQVCVLGAGLAAPVALIVPEPDVVRAAVRRLGLRVFSRRQALTHPRLVRWLARRLAKRQAHLPRAWRVRRAAFVGRPFDAAHGEATPAFKLKRPAIADHFSFVVAAAAEPVPPAWMADVPGGRRPEAAAAPVAPLSAPHPLASALWQGAEGGLAAAAAASASPLRDAIAAILEQTDRALDALRADHLLYEPLPPAAPPAPLADAPPAPSGRFTAAAEAALGDVGLWGLAVPEAFGGAGASMLDLARAITHVAARVPTAAGLLSVHSSIGAVSAIAAFGSPDQQARHLPGLAQGRPLSVFAATEPDAGCDLAAISTTIERTPAGLAVSGTKMFITGATHGRLVKLLALHDGRPAVALVRLPESDTPSFRLRHYALHPLKHAHNAALEFDRFPLADVDLLQAPAGRDGRNEPDAMRIIWHGLNRGRITLAAQAAGTLRILLAQARDHALRRVTWGAPIASRELVQGRLGRIAARIVACDALAAWAATAIDAGGSGELEALTAKIVAGECVRDSAIDALGVHGGRAFLVGHPLGDSFHDHFAVTVYEGESDLLGLALFKGIAKRHPLAGVLRSSAAARAAAWLAWRAAAFARADHDGAILDQALRAHARSARRGLSRMALAIDRAIRRHGHSLAERQLEIGALSARVRDLSSVIAVAHHADADAGDHTLAAADVWCRLALARASGRSLTSADHAAIAALGKAVAGRLP